MTDRFETMPKVELHLHLEGAIPLHTMWELVEGHGGDPEVATSDALVERFAYTDFAHFIETWVWKNRFLDSYEAFEHAAEAVARDLARRHIVYAEAFFSPTDFRDYGLTPGELALAIRRGLDRVAETQIALIVDLVRDTGPDSAMATLLGVADAAEDAGVIGIGIGGFEAENPPEPFADVYRKAAGLGFRLTAHAGEAAGPASVWGAIRALGVERIGHGVRSVEDPELLFHLQQTQLPLEVCPTSNLRTGVVATWEAHPVRTLIDLGLNVTINTDDPAMFHTTLAGEYEELQQHYGYDDEVIKSLASNSVDASFADETFKSHLHALLAGWWPNRG